MTSTNTPSTNNDVKRALTIAGSDSGGGAGIQADLKTFTALGIFGTSVVTALTAQNTLGVQGVFDVSPEFVDKQLESVLLDIGTDAVKTGMLWKAPIITAVAQSLKKFGVKKLVLDPVMASTTGSLLLAQDAKDTLLKELFPLALIVTPNLPEASAIVGHPVVNIDEMKQAAQEIQKLGPTYVLVKGGHLEGPQITDILYDGTVFHEFKKERLKNKNTHGTGCTLASAICAFLAKGKGVVESVKEAQDFVHITLKEGFESIGKGNVVILNHMLKNVEHIPLFEKLKAACMKEWSEYVNHKFVLQMQDGTLPIECFQYYIKQDYLFLNQFARANALACYKTEDTQLMKESTQIIAEIVGVEKDLHQTYCGSWGINKADLDKTVEANATLAYTRYVLEQGVSGDILDLRVALAPCVCGYGEIGLRLAQDSKTKKDGNPFKSWIDMYASEWYQTGVKRAQEQLDYLLKMRGDSNERFQQLVKIFRQAVQLEINFWEMGLTFKSTTTSQSSS